MVHLALQTYKDACRAINEHISDVYFALAETLQETAHSANDMEV